MHFEVCAHLGLLHFLSYIYYFVISSKFVTIKSSVLLGSNVIDTAFVHRALLLYVCMSTA